MKFSILKLVLWLNNGKIREIKFEKNKVNIITGDSHTGKTAILQIFDYCFFASTSKISESIINENVSWYGFQIELNEEKFLLARSAPTASMISDEYYFSQEPEIPDKLESNTSEDAVKAVMETAFSINNKVSIAYGGNSIKAGSKISVRYFLLFNTLSGNIIDNDSGIYFDKQTEARYREALPRIFDIAMGIETVENILKKERRSDLEAELNRIQKKRQQISEKEITFKTELSAIVKQAKEYSIIDEALDLDAALEQLSAVLSQTNMTKTSSANRDSLERELNLKNRKIRNLQRFVGEYSQYKKGLESIDDSLKPLGYLLKRENQIIKTSIFDDLLQSYADDLLSIKRARRGHTPIDSQIRDAINELQSEIDSLKKRLEIMPDKNLAFENEKQKYFFLGEIKSKLKIFMKAKSLDTDEYEKEIDRINLLLKDIHVVDTDEKKQIVIKVIEEIIESYIKFAGPALENYQTFKPVFDYKNKALNLRQPKSTTIENVGSSSNHMFLHLFQMLGLHELSFGNDSPYIAPFLIIDQPSRPYFGTPNSKKEKLDHSDELKIGRALSFIDDFIERRKKATGEFQAIIFEHVPVEIFIDNPNTHLVEEFRDGNALIPAGYLNDEQESPTPSSI